ncbi:MAG: hypothetical protein CVU88_00245 [Firmicutes bacterium HGW-Firmicutes-13]|nr:MAG: hypothetical protein CVU88_00245 [Firmicutes bacterium HGW-Firmicutes-13]
MIDLCNSSNPENGIRFSENYLKLMQHLREFSFKNIYYHKRLSYFHDYAELIIRSIFRALKSFYSREKTLDHLNEYQLIYPLLVKEFTRWIIKYSHIQGFSRPADFQNKIIYDLNNEKDYLMSIVDFISGMTDNFAIKIFKELTSF